MASTTEFLLAVLRAVRAQNAAHFTRRADRVAREGTLVDVGAAAPPSSPHSFQVSKVLSLVLGGPGRVRPTRAQRSERGPAPRCDHRAPHPLRTPTTSGEERQSPMLGG